MLRFMLLLALSIPAGERVVLVNGFALVNAYLNHSGPFLFFIDTGATSSAVSPAAARHAGVRPDHRVALSAAGGDRIVPAAAGASIRIGQSSADQVELLILSLDTLRAVDPRIQGIIGQNFLSRFPCLLDYRERRLWLGEEAVRRAENLPDRISAETAAGRIVVPVTIESGKPLRLVLDSGASDLTLSCGDRCPPLVTSEHDGQLHSNTGSRDVRRGILPAIQVGAIRILRPKVALLERAPTASEDGLLPAHLFAAIYLAPGRNEIRLVR